MPTRFARISIGFCLLALAGCSASTGSSPSSTASEGGGSPDASTSTGPEPTATAAPSDEPTGSDLSGGDPAADLWIFRGDGIIRADATTGEEVGQRAFEDWGCQWHGLAGVGPSAAWIVGVGIGSIPEGGMFPPPPSEDPLTGGCVGRLPLDGGEAEIFTFDVPEGERPHFWDGAVHGEDALFAVAHIANEGGALGTGNSDLYRASADGTVEIVASGIVDVAVAGDSYFVINDPDSDGFTAAARVDPDSGEVTQVPFDAIPHHAVYNVEANGDLAVFSITSSEPYGRGLIATDADGTVIGSAIEQVADGESLFSYRGIWVTPDALIAQSDGVVMAPMEQNATVEILDVCSPIGTPDDPPECRYDALYGVADGVWAQHTVQTATPQVTTLRRYDGASRTKGAEVELPTVVR